MNMTAEERKELYNIVYRIVAAEQLVIASKTIDNCTLPEAETVQETLDRCAVTAARRAWKELAGFTRLPEGEDLPY